jgi:hypothetical protein
VESGFQLEGVKPEAATSGEIPAAHDRLEALNRFRRQARIARISEEMRVKMLAIATTKYPCAKCAQG